MSKTVKPIQDAAKDTLQTVQTDLQTFVLHLNSANYNVINAPINPDYQSERRTLQTAFEEIQKAVGALQSIADNGTKASSQGFKDLLEYTISPPTLTASAGAGINDAIKQFVGVYREQFPISSRTTRITGATRSFTP